MQCRYAPSLGELEGTPYEAWGTEEYKSRKEPTVFFGMFDLRDYIALARHQGKAWILWAGSDIRNFLRGYTLNDGKLRLISNLLGGNRWVFPILRKAEHWVENYSCRDALRAVGIEANVGQSFMGDKNAFRVTYQHSLAPRVYICSPEGRQTEYGFDVVERIAESLPFSFHLYGASWETKNDNVFVHGRVPKEQMNEEIKDMQIALRLNKFDGFSELLAKGILMGHHPVSRLEYPFIPRCDTDEEIIERIKAYKQFDKTDYYRQTINTFPWTQKR